MARWKVDEMVLIGLCAQKAKAQIEEMSLVTANLNENKTVSKYDLKGVRIPNLSTISLPLDVAVRYPPTQREVFRRGLQNKNNRCLHSSATPGKSKTTNWQNEAGEFQELRKIKVSTFNVRHSEPNKDLPSNPAWY